MKNIFTLLTLTFLLTGFYSCNKVEAPDTSYCHNGIKDGTETEIDCGGLCDSCAATAVVSCNLGTGTFISTRSDQTFAQVLTNSMRIYANDGRAMFFMFQPTALNTPLPIFALNFEYQGEAYTLETGNMGEVMLTSNDTVKKVMSGTFWFTAGRVTGPDTTSARNGVFTNVRYKNI